MPTNCLENHLAKFNIDRIILTEISDGLATQKIKKIINRLFCIDFANKSLNMPFYVGPFNNRCLLYVENLSDVIQYKYYYY